MRTIKILLALLVLAVNGWAAPQIASDSGTYTNGESITITSVSGHGFGTKAAAPLISSYDNATSANNWHGGSIGGAWHQVAGGADPVTLTETSPRSSLYQSDHKGTYNAAGTYSAVYLNPGSVEDKLYLSGWHYRDYTSFIGSANTKFFRVYQSSDTSDAAASLILSLEPTGGNCGDGNAYFAAEHAPSCTGWVFTSNISGVSCGSYFLNCLTYASGVGPQFQTWEHWEIYIDYPSTIGGTDGSAVLWKNGQRLLRGNNIALGRAGDPNDNRLILIGQISGGLTGTEYLDQLYFDNTASHVFISDQSGITDWDDYESVAHNEIQVPSSWSDSSITFTLNQGTFGDTDTAYLYVVDSAGAISPAYEITLSGEGGGASPAPPTLSNVTISGGSFR